MRFLTGIGRVRGRLVLLTAMVAALAIGGAAAKVGQAGTTTNGVLTAAVSFATDQSGVPLAPTPGGNAAYDLNVSNGSTNTLNHLLFTDTNGPGGTVLQFTAPPTVSCSGVGTSTLSCSSAQLISGASFDVIVLFKTDSTGTAGGPIAQNTMTGTYAPQSNNSSNSRTDPTKTFNATSPAENYGGGNGQVVTQSLTLPGDPLGNNAGGFFTANIKMPPGFLHSNNFVGVTLQNTAGVLPTNAPVVCPKCQPFQVTTTIPLATAVTDPFNPFLQGGSTSPYTWSFTIPWTANYKPSAVFHTDDSDLNGVYLPNCQIVNGVPVPSSAAPGLCITGIVYTKGHNGTPNTATYSGLGLANGHGYGV